MFPWRRSEREIQNPFVRRILRMLCIGIPVIILSFIPVADLGLYRRKRVSGILEFCSRGGKNMHLKRGMMMGAAPLSYMGNRMRPPKPTATKLWCHQR